MSVFNRLINVIKNEIRYNFSLKEKPFANQEDFEESANFSFNEKKQEKTSQKASLEKLKEDLALFDLKPPINLGELKKKRNAIYKKYHPDLFNNNHEKKEMAKEMIQLYNDAYNRLLEYYHN